MPMTLDVSTLRRSVSILSACCALALLASTARAAEPALSVEPTEGYLRGNLARLQLLVTARQQGREADATRQARYENLSDKIIQVTEHGQVIPLAAGKAEVRVHYAGTSITVPITVSDLLPAPRASYREDVIPMLSKAGCNQGACHGAQYGQGGLKLSLLGYAPEQDYPQLVRDWAQRRISMLDADDSLLLRKATMDVAHGGGRRFKEGSYEYEVIAAWIANRAPGLVKNEPEVVDLTVSPLERVYKLEDHQQLRVVAHISDGTTRDVTQCCKYDSLGDGVAHVAPDGYVKIVGQGQAAIMVRYQGQAKVSHIISPYATNVDLAGFVPANFVDEKVKSRWQRLGLKPSPVCSDQEFIRRVFLDTIGTLPKRERVEAFLASSDPHKREALVDELLGLTGDLQRDIYVNEWSAYWALKWGDLLRNNRNQLGDGGMWALYNWTRQSLRENKPVDKFVREIITAEGSIYQNGPANFYKVSNKADDLAETTAQVFLGVRLQCAKCHHHPFEVYSQTDYYSLAAFFTRVGTKGSSDFGPLGGDTVVKVNATGNIRHPRTGQVMLPTPLLGKPIDQKDTRDLRRPLADWLTSPGNRLFSRNIVNRIWGYLMGTGLVEPIDDMRATNPPSNPELLDALADQFVADKYDLRKLMRAILTSRVYQLESDPSLKNAGDARFYTHYNVKRLPAEVLLDAIDDLCGTQERFTGVPLGTRAIELPDPNYNSYFLDTLGRPQRAIACECERTADPNLAQVLQIANGEMLNRKLGEKGGRIARFVKKKFKDEDAITELYLVGLSRRPSEQEIANCKTIIARATNHTEGLEDILWALCNSREFLFNH